MKKSIWIIAAGIVLLAAFAMWSTRPEKTDMQSDDLALQAPDQDLGGADDAEADDGKEIAFETLDEATRKKLLEDDVEDSSEVGATAMNGVPAGASAALPPPIEVDDHGPEFEPESFVMVSQPLDESDRLMAKALDE